MPIALLILFVAAVALLFGTQASGEEVTQAENTGTPLSPFAEAIGHGEGFFNAGTRPNRNNNPGDFVLAPPATAYTDKSDGTYAIFDTVADGWQTLEDELDLWRRNASPVYKEWAKSLGLSDISHLTFNQLAQKYSPDGWQNWAKNVSSFLGAQPTEQIGAYL